MDIEDGRDNGIQCHPCAQCALSINESEDSVECFGKCKLAIHVACLPGATEVELNLFRKIENCVFVCDACMALHEYEDGHEKKMLEEILNKINELACVIDLAKNFEKKVKAIVSSELSMNIKRSTTASANRETTGSESCRVLRSTSKKRKLNDVQSEKKYEETTEPTFANIVRKNPIEKRDKANEEMRPKLLKKPDTVVVIKPKEGSEMKNTREELKKQINPKNVNFSKVIQGKDGKVTVLLKDEASSKLLKENIERNMGNQYEVSVREGMKPTIKIVGMSEEMNENTLKETLVDQNEVFNELKHFKLRKFYCNEKWKYGRYSGIVELDAKTFFKVMEIQKLNVGWDRCRVFDGLEVTRCFKCCVFNHKAADCKAERETCPICSGEHNVKQCQAKGEKCINCERIKSERKLDIDVNHPAWSNQCPVYLRLKHRRNEQVDFTA